MATNVDYDNLDYDIANVGNFVNAEPGLVTPRFGSQYRNLKKLIQDIDADLAEVMIGNPANTSVTKAGSYPAGSIGDYVVKSIPTIGMAPYLATESGINQALADAAGGDVYMPSGTVTIANNLVNPRGSRLFGPGEIRKAATQGGFYQVTRYGDLYRDFIGLEYLYRFWLRALVGGNLTIHTYGDSTEATSANGGGYAGVAGGYADNRGEFQAIFKENLRAAGVWNPINITNHGVGGTSFRDCNPVADIDTVTGSVDMMIFKFGINDIQYGLAQFAIDMDTKLAAVRANAYGTWDQISIVLVMPNAVFDPGHGRDSRWFEKIRGIYVAAARKHRCFLFDTYGLMPDVELAATASAGHMMDNPFGNGQGVHPKRIFQSLIVGRLVDAMCGPLDSQLISTRQWRPLTLLNGWSQLGGAVPCGARRRQDGTIEVRGMITGGTLASGTDIFTLPPGLQPPYLEVFTARTPTGSCGIRYDNATGNFDLADNQASATWVGFSFFCSIEQ